MEHMEHTDFGGSPQLPSHLSWQSHPRSSGKKELLFLLLFNCACLFQAGHTLVVPQWCIQPGNFPSFCPFASLTVLSSLKSIFFFTGKLTVVSPCLWLIVLIAAEMNCVGTYCEMEKYPLYSAVFLTRDAQEMPDKCSFQVSLGLNFQGSPLNAERASDTEHFLSQEK